MRGHGRSLRTCAISSGKGSTALGNAAMAVITSSPMNWNYRPNSESTPAEILTSGTAGLRAQRTYDAAVYAETTPPKRTSNGLGRRQRPKGGANVRCLKNRTSGIDPERS